MKYFFQSILMMILHMFFLLPLEAASKKRMDFYIAIYFDDAAFQKAQLSGGTRNYALRCVSELNQALRNSDVNEIRFHLYNTQNSKLGSIFPYYASDKLDRLSNYYTGSISKAKGLKTSFTPPKVMENMHKADFVALIVGGRLMAKESEVRYDNYGKRITEYEIGGMANAHLSEHPFSNSNRPSFSVSAFQSSSLGSYIFVHEVGHNMGCGHSRKQNKQRGPQSYLSWVKEKTDNQSPASGYYYPNYYDAKTKTRKDVCTVMCYDQKVHNDFNRHFERLNVFSSSKRNTKYGITLGDRLNDNVKALRLGLKNYDKMRNNEEIVKKLSPINDMQASATRLELKKVLDQEKYATTANCTTQGATREEGELVHHVAAQHSVWYKFFAPEKGIFRLKTTQSNFAPQMALYEVSSGRLTRVASAAAMGRGQTNTSLYYPNMKKGCQYLLAVDGVSGSSGKLVQHLELSPPSTVMDTVKYEANNLYEWAHENKEQLAFAIFMLLYAVYLIIEIFFGRILDRLMN